MRLGIAAFTLAAGLGFIGLASAQEGGTFFERPFGPAPERTEKTEPAKRVEVKAEPIKAPAVSSNVRAMRALADLERRREVCLKLREVGLASGDEDLVRKAEMLDQRAWDLYRARSSPRLADETDGKQGDRK
jgi:hypothetical protein